ACRWHPAGHPPRLAEDRFWRTRCRPRPRGSPRLTGLGRARRWHPTAHPPRLAGCCRRASNCRHPTAHPPGLAARCRGRPDRWHPRPVADGLRLPIAPVLLRDRRGEQIGAVADRRPALDVEIERAALARNPDQLGLLGELGGERALDLLADRRGG